MKRLLSLLGLLAWTSPAAAQNAPQVFNAFAVVQADGTLVRAADQEVSLVGTLKGRMFVETDEGPVEAGTMVCSAAMRFDQSNRSQRGKGACTFMAFDGATAWADWECAGYDYVGCHGRMTVNGGTGRLEGVKGEGAMVWRPSAHDFTLKPDSSGALRTSGIVIWRDFSLAKK